jgi:hypothetical protein
MIGRPRPHLSATPNSHRLLEKGVLTYRWGSTIELDARNLTPLIVSPEFAPPFLSLSHVRRIVADLCNFNYHS